MDLFRGYTLLEMLAVLILIGFLAVLVYPEFAKSLEEMEIISIGKLIRSDLATARLEAIAGRRTILVCFAENGYVISGGGLEVTRTFGARGFSFHLPAPDESADENRGEDEESAVSARLAFDKTGTCLGLKLGWETANFAGRLGVTEGGEVSWEYAPRSRSDALEVSP